MKTPTTFVATTILVVALFTASNTALFAQGMVTIGTNAPSDSVDLSLYSPDQTILFEGASGGDDAASVNIYGATVIDWDGDVIFDSAGILNIADGSTLYLNTLVKGGGDIIKESGGSLVIADDVNDFYGNVIVKEGTLSVFSNYFGVNGNEDTLHNLHVESEARYNIGNTTQAYDKLSGGGSINIDDGTVWANFGTMGGIYGSAGTFNKVSDDLLTVEHIVFDGTVNVKQGTLALGGDSSYFAATNGINVDAGAVLSLVSYYGDPLISDTIISMQDHARLNLTVNGYSNVVARFQDSMVFVNPKDVHFEGISYLAPSQIKTILFAGVEDVVMSDFKSNWEAGFDKPLIHTTITGGNENYSMNINAVALTDFASSASGAFNKNQMMQISQMEADRLNWSLGDADRNIFEDLYNSADAYNTLRDMVGYLAEPNNEIADSFVGFQVGQVNQFSDIAFSSSDIWRDTALGQYGNQNTNPNAIRGQCCSTRIPVTYYVQPYYRSVQADTVGAQMGYGIDRLGFLSGMNFDFDKQTSGGFNLGYSSPKMYQRGREVETNDFAFGLHYVKTLPANFDIALWVGGSVQDGNSTRSEIWQDGNIHNYNGNLSGRAFTAALNAVKRIPINQYVLLKPTIGLTYEQAWTDGFAETTDAPYAFDSSISDYRLSRRRYEDAEYARTVFKVGTMGSISGSKGGIAGKVLYGRQIAGDDYADINAVFLDGGVTGLERTYSSLPLGKDFVYLEGGVNRFLNQKRTVVLSGTHNVTLYSNTTVQNTMVGLSWMK